MDSELVKSLSAISEALNAQMIAFGRLDLEGRGFGKTLDQFQVLIDRIDEDIKYFTSLP